MIDIYDRGNFSLYFGVNDGSFFSHFLVFATDENGKNHSAANLFTTRNLWIYQQDLRTQIAQIEFVYSNLFPARRVDHFC